MSEIFGDLISNEGLKDAKNKARSLRSSYYKLETEVDNASVGIEKLLNAVKRTHKAMDGTSQSEIIENVKNEMDKIAYLIEDFVSEFKPLYDEVINRYMIEQMSGTFDKNPTDDDCDVCQTMPYNPNVGWSKNDE